MVKTGFEDPGGRVATARLSASGAVWNGLELSKINLQTSNFSPTPRKRRVQRSFNHNKWMYSKTDYFIQLRKCPDEHQIYSIVVSALKVEFFLKTLQHCNTAALQHCNTATLQHCNTATLQDCKTVKLQHCSTATL